MCGIVGIISKKTNVTPDIVKVLSDIEYRGYDSWGISYFINGKFKTVKEVGFIPREILLEDSNCGIGHTRWATHGGVTRENAHPHQNTSQTLSLVHNGIVENYVELKKGLKNYTFKSETDSEVIIHLIDEEMKKTSCLKDAVAEVFKKLEGFNGIVVSDGTTIVACKNSSPLAVGQLTQGYAIASDGNCLLPLTENLLFLEDNQLIVINEEAKVYDINSGQEIDFRFTKVNWDYNSSSLGDFPHYMLKEIFEQSSVMNAIIENKQEITKIDTKIKDAEKIYFVGCGSASYASLLGKYLFSKYAKLDAGFCIGSEFPLIQHFLKANSLLMVVSQSGETMDVVEPVNYAKTNGTKVIALTNCIGSTLNRKADNSLILKAGVEKAVCATKSFTAMAGNLLLLSLGLAGQTDLGEAILKFSSREIKSILRRKDSIKSLADKLIDSKHIYVLGRGLSYPVAMETALKIKEVSYIHAEGFAGGELKHGVMALIEKGTPVIVFAPNDDNQKAILANAMEVKSRGAYVIGVGEENNEVFDYFFKVEEVGASSILPNCVFGQLLAYYLSVAKGFNPDKPRNLAKSVVVK